MELLGISFGLGSKPLNDSNLGAFQIGNQCSCGGFYYLEKE